MDAAIAYKLAHPQQTYAKVAERFEVAASTLHDRMTDRHAAPGQRHSQNLSIEQEGAVINKINDYAERGTLLTPGHVKDLANALAERPVGINWVSTFIRRHRDKIISRFYRIQEAARIKADVLETRQAFHALVIEI